MARVSDFIQQVDTAGGSVPVGTGPNNERRDAAGNLIGFTMPENPEDITPEQRTFYTRMVRNQLSAQWWANQGKAQRAEASR